MNSFFGIGVMELFFVAVLALIVLGPERLPGAIREVMKHWRTVRNLSNELTSQFSEELQALDELNPQNLVNELTGEPAKTSTKTGAAKTGAAKTGAAKKSPTKSSTAKKSSSTGAAKTSASKASSSKSSAPKATTSKSAPSKKDGSDSSGGAAAATASAAKSAGANGRSSADSPAQGQGADQHSMNNSAPEETGAEETGVENSILPPEKQAADVADAAADANAGVARTDPPVDSAAVSVNGSQTHTEDNA